MPIPAGIFRGAGLLARGMGMAGKSLMKSGSASIAANRAESIASWGAADWQLIRGFRLDKAGAAIGRGTLGAGRAGAAWWRNAVSTEGGAINTIIESRRNIKAHGFVNAAKFGLNPGMDRAAAEAALEERAASGLSDRPGDVMGAMDFFSATGRKAATLTGMAALSVPALGVIAYGAGGTKSRETYMRQRYGVQTEIPYVSYEGNMTQLPGMSAPDADLVFAAHHVSGSGRRRH